MLFRSLNYEDDDMQDKFENEIVDLAMFFYKNRDRLGKIQVTQGPRSQTVERGLPKFIKESLPYPKVRIIG